MKEGYMEGPPNATGVNPPAEIGGGSDKPSEPLKISERAQDLFATLRALSENTEKWLSPELIQHVLDAQPTIDDTSVFEACQVVVSRQLEQERSRFEDEVGQDIADDPRSSAGFDH